MIKLTKVIRKLTKIWFILACANLIIDSKDSLN